AVGEENALRIRIYGTENALEWAQEDPETLIMRYKTGHRQVMRPNWAGAGAAWSRLPAGHPEGFFEAFGNLYTDIANAIAARADGIEYVTSYPTVEDGVRGVAFIEAVVRSSVTESKWIKFEV
ncbi:MAG: gfo/Idh/MocA family oxidoreductase, partial [Lentisphaeria bacterium]|nr:gfo/Idh/MocA family oxidoreductase [Lentisphaeria bacterium]